MGESIGQGVIVLPDVVTPELHSQKGHRMKIVLHAGMPKTGSSAIQASFAQADLPGVGYLPWRGINHGALLALLCEEHPEKHRVFAHRENAAQVVEALRKTWAPKVDQALSEQGSDTVIVSSERIFNLSLEDKQRLHDFFAARRSEIDVIVYVRPPASYLPSAFQQNTAAGAGPLEFDKIWPRYRARIGALDRVFGRENVQCIPFSREQLVGGDAVLDFAHRIGVTLPPEQVVTSNESRPLQAVALLYAAMILRQGGAKIPRLAPPEQDALVQELGRRGGDKFAIHPDLYRPVMEQWAEDTEWLEKRMGQGMSAMPAPAPGALTSLTSLMDIAQSQKEALLTLQADQGSPRARFIQALAAAL